VLSHRQTAAFYDRLGRKQDWQDFFEREAIEALLRNGRFETARSVLELGCGTGKFAEGLLDRHLPSDARYVGVDISRTMRGIAAQRLERFGERAVIVATDGAPRFDLAHDSFDRFVSNYVLDLLSLDDIRGFLEEARRVLVEAGLIGLTSLTHGFTLPSRIVEAVWTRVHAKRPSLVGGCRPIHLAGLAHEPSWRHRYHARIVSWGVPSEVLVAEKRPEPSAGTASPSHSSSRPSCWV
jgi:ubiquinone/menaquinone biosynthesis C-methylase UbiE